MAFGVPSGYRENPVITDSEGGFDYWTDERVESSRRFQWAVYKFALKVARERGARTVMDVGCGPATKLDALFEGFDVYGVDQPAAIEACRRLKRTGTFAVVDLATDPEPPFGSMDLVICSDVIEHLADPTPLLRFVRAACGGVAVFSTPARDRMGAESAEGPTNPAHVREWSRQEFAELLRSSGFRVVRQEVQLPFRLAGDEMTARWLLDCVRYRRPLRSNQVALVEA